MRFIIISISLLFVLACKRDKPLSKEETEQLPKDFISFYERFHKDTAFQLEHCIFPMQGLPDQADSTVDASTFRWTRENWKIQKTIDLPESYQRVFSTFGPEMIIERIIDERQGLGMERRWAKFDKDWSLFYYVGLNQFSKGGN
jgi:hypothetical protein